MTAEFKIKRGDPQWSHWIAHLIEDDQKAADAAEAAGELTSVGSRWPENSKDVRIKHYRLTDKSKQMVVECE